MYLLYGYYIYTHVYYNIQMHIGKYNCNKILNTSEILVLTELRLWLNYALLPHPGPWINSGCSYSDQDPVFFRILPSSLCAQVCTSTEPEVLHGHPKLQGCHVIPSQLTTSNMSWGSWRGSSCPAHLCNSGSKEIASVGTFRKPFLSSLEGEMKSELSWGIWPELA